MNVTVSVHAGAGWLERQAVARARAALWEDAVFRGLMLADWAADKYLVMYDRAVELGLDHDLARLVVRDITGGDVGHR